MFKWLVATAMAVLIAPIGASAQPATTYFKLTSSPHYDQYRPRLAEYLRSRHYHKATRFCLFGSKDDTGDTATIIWPDGQEIIDWGGNDAALTESTSVVHLKTDVVPTENDLLGSSYLVTRQWVKDQQALCKRYGETVQVSADTGRQ